MKRYLYDGLFLPLYVIADRCGIKRGTLDYRVRVKGMDLSQAISAGRYENSKTRKPALYEYRGKLRTVAEIARIEDVALSTVYRRRLGDVILPRGHKDPNPSYQDAPINARLLTFRGKTDTVGGWARRMGVPKHVLFSRLAMGWPVKRVLTEPPMRGKQRNVFIHNRRILQRITTSFRTPRSSQTFTPPKGTGGGRQEFEFEGTSP